ncbi:ComEC/Rec2 family competence protein [Geodermatophilus sp. YIM 151500]|nr:ComEC/Rec2 family competence protein [Geodermatophilus sp. YIM 151500]
MQPGRWIWVDLRLVPVAGAVWATSVLAPHVPAPALATAVLVCAAASAILRRRAARRAVGAVLAVLAAIAVTAGLAAGRAVARGTSPLADLARTGAVADVELRLDGDPRLLAGGAPGRIVADATVTALAGARPVNDLDAAVVLFAPADGWLDLLPGQAVAVRVEASPPRPGDLLVATLSARGPPEPLGTLGPAQRAAGVLRAGLADAAARLLPDRPAGLLPGLVVGDTRDLDPVLDDEFRRAGLSHLTAVSGANVAIALTAVLWPLRRRAVDRRVQALVGVAALLAFVVLARPGASVVRAAAMGAVTLWGLAAGRPRAAMPALGAAVTVLLLAVPELARDPGFALSVAATAAIVLLAPGWSRRLRDHGWPPALADAVAVAASAGLATAPLVAGLSGSVSIVSLPANLLAVPAVAPATVLGLAATVLGPLVPPLADLLVWLAGWPTRWLVLVAERAAGLPDAVAGWPAGTRGAVLLTALLLLCGGLLWRFRRLRPLALVALVALVAVGWPLRQFARGWPPSDTVLVACDVGQGDALVVPTAPGAAVLVDAGPDVGAVDRCLDRLGVDVLPLVLLSHLDADHVDGLAGALTGRRVGTVATGTLPPSDERAAGLDALLRRRGVPRTVLAPGDRRDVGDVRVDVLAPAPEQATASTTGNDLSLVVRVSRNGLRILLTGDLGAEAEGRILRAGTDLRADVLKVPHHGSGDADPAFLAATGARVALVSVGADNRYGHPAARLLTWLGRAGMRVHRTDREGDLAVAGTAGRWGVAARGRAAGGGAVARPAGDGGGWVRPPGGAGAMARPAGPVDAGGGGAGPAAPVVPVPGATTRGRGALRRDARTVGGP